MGSSIGGDYEMGIIMHQTDRGADYDPLSQFQMKIQFYDEKKYLVRKTH
jgi:hypothetical protein